MSEKGHRTNLASEFFVMSTLYRRGLEPLLTLGNKKAVDIVVPIAAGRAITIDVKAVAGKHDWMTSKPDGEPTPDHFVVLVGYEGQFADPFEMPVTWVLPHKVFLSFVKSSANKKAHFLSRKRIREECEAFRGEPGWQLIDARVC